MGEHWTVEDMPNQSGRRAIVTGANSGIGYYAALALARNGAHVVLACRNRMRGEAALARLLQTLPNAQAEVGLLDLASLNSVREFAAAEMERDRPLDLLINNAGVMAPKKRLETKDGLELQFGTNVLGHFLLTELLLPALVRAAKGPGERPRIVTIASIAHKRGQVNLDDLQSAKSYSPMAAYQQSKLANLMLSLELDRRLRAAGEPVSRIMSVAAHPGVANTNLFQAGEFGRVERLVRRGMGAAINVLLSSEAEGALATLYAATATDVRDGGYYGPQGFREMRGLRIGAAQVSLHARDERTSARLWRECEKLSGLGAVD